MKYLNSGWIFVTSSVALLSLAGCSSKMKNFQSDYFGCNPSPLEVVGQNVPATVTGRIPQKFFAKNAEVTVTPVLVFPNGKVSASPVTFQGENIRGNFPTISYEKGGVITIPVDYVYQPEMRKSELLLDFAVKQGNKQYALPSVKVANGVIATATLADVSTVNPALSEDKYQRIVNEKYRADIHFLVNQANIRASESNSEGMTEFKGEIKKASEDSRKVIEEINISSYASPEGSYQFNYDLAEKREENTDKYIREELKKAKITEFGEMTAQFTPEDWEGFQELVAASNIQDKELILSVLSLYKDPILREQEIRNLSNIFEQLAETILPQLRRSKLTASVNVIGRSDEEINQTFDTNPTLLSADELLYAANLTQDPSRKRSIYEAAVKQYPSDHRAYNNLGRLYYTRHDYTNAKAYFEQARAINPNAGEISMNEALLDMLNHDMTSAEQHLGQAGNVREIGEAMGTYYLIKGDNLKAVNAFADTKSNNAALAQILTKDYSKASRILNDINPDATTYYLKAVVCARTNNSKKALSNLSKAINADNSLLDRAINDLEFSRIDLSSLKR